LKKFGKVEYYTTTEACNMAGVSKGTFFRWVREGIIPDVKTKNRNGWRLFTMEDIKAIQDENNLVVKN